jgi:hypothetical protein
MHCNNWVFHINFILLQKASYNIEPFIYIFALRFDSTINTLGFGLFFCGFFVCFVLLTYSCLLGKGCLRRPLFYCLTNWESLKKQKKFWAWGFVVVFLFVCLFFFVFFFLGHIFFIVFLATNVQEKGWVCVLSINNVVQWFKIILANWENFNEFCIKGKLNIFTHFLLLVFKSL